MADRIAEAWRDLGRAVVIRAVKDYRIALRRSLKARRSASRREARWKAEQIEDFLCGRGHYAGWCEMLYPEINGEFLAREVHRIVEENHRLGRD